MMGINPERIVFLNKLSTNDYLKILAQMDIILGSSPEQGGITCYDALMCNVPYIVYAGNSSTLPSSYILQRLGKNKWITHSSTEFISTIKDEIRNINNSKVISLEQDCVALSDELKNLYIKKILKGLNMILKDAHNE